MDRKEYLKKYYQQNRKRLDENQAEYRKNHREKYRGFAKKYYHQGQDRKRANRKKLDDIRKQQTARDESNSITSYT